jgi:hypothetical protein
MHRKFKQLMPTALLLASPFCLAQQSTLLEEANSLLIVVLKR